MRYVIQIWDNRKGWEDFSYPESGKEFETFDHFVNVKTCGGTTFRLIKQEIVIVSKNTSKKV